VGGGFRTLWPGAHRAGATCPRPTAVRQFKARDQAACDGGSRATTGAAGQTFPQGPPCRRGSASHTRRQKSDLYVKSIDNEGHFHYTHRQCQSRSTPPVVLPNPPKGLVRASSAASAARCAAPLSAASYSPAPCGAQPPRKPAATTPRRKIRKPPRPSGYLLCTRRAPRPPLPLCGRGRPRSGRVRAQPRSCRTCSRVCSPPVLTAAPHVSTAATHSSPRRHFPSSAPAPVRFSTLRSRTAIPRPCGWCSPRSPSTSIRSCRPRRVSPTPRQSFPTCGTASAPRSLTPTPMRVCPPRRRHDQPPLRTWCRMRRSHRPIRQRRHRQPSPPGSGQTSRRASRRYRCPARRRPTSQPTPRSPPPHRRRRQKLPRPHPSCTEAEADRSVTTYNLSCAGTASASAPHFSLEACATSSNASRRRGDCITPPALGRPEPARAKSGACQKAMNGTTPTGVPPSRFVPRQPHRWLAALPDSVVSREPSIPLRVRRGPPPFLRANQKCNGSHSRTACADPAASRALGPPFHRPCGSDLFLIRTDEARRNSLTTYLRTSGIRVGLLLNFNALRPMDDLCRYVM